MDPALKFALIAQWIEREPPELETGVRLLLGAQGKGKFSAGQVPLDLPAP